jgi:hypothetical protein
MTAMRLIWERMPNSISNKMPANSNTDSNPRMAISSARRWFGAAMVFNTAFSCLIDTCIHNSPIKAGNLEQILIFPHLQYTG